MGHFRGSVLARRQDRRPAQRGNARASAAGGQRHWRTAELDRITGRSGRPTAVRRGAAAQGRQCLRRLALRLSRLATPLTLAALAAATLALRLPLLAPRLAHWDAVNYALGLHNFDIAAHQPHPPGSPYFILLGRAVLALVGDDNMALSLVALGASVLAVVGEYAFIRMAFGRRAALLGACLFATQPIFWAYGTIANAWSLLAAVAIGIGIM